MAGRIPYNYASLPPNPLIRQSHQIPPPPPPPPGQRTQGTLESRAYPYGYGSSHSIGQNYGVQSSQLAYSFVPGQAPPALPVNQQAAQSTFSIQMSQNHKRQPSTDEKSLNRNSKKRRPADGEGSQKNSVTWYCDACELDFDSEKALKSHRKSHVKCTDCSFEGSPKVVKAHFQASHGRFSGSGFKTVTVAIPGCRVQRFRICVGNRPEDIARWISERKKRFPRQVQPVNMNTPVDSKASKNDSGMSSLLAGYGSSDSDEDKDVNVEGGERTSSLKEAPKEVVESPIDKTKNEKFSDKTTGQNKNIDVARSQGKTRLCRYFMRNGKCLNGDSCRFSHELGDQQFQAEKRKRKRPNRHTSNDTLLRKLLVNDMDRETTLTLKLLKFIVKRNFFDVADCPDQEK